MNSLDTCYYKYYDTFYLILSNKNNVECALSGKNGIIGIAGIVGYSFLNEKKLGG